MAPPIMGNCMDCRRPARRRQSKAVLQDLLCNDCLAALAGEGMEIIECRGATLETPMTEIRRYVIR